MMISIFKKKKPLDINEPIPFCMRCFNAGAIAGDNPYDNFCHMCGSQGTCISIKRKDFQYLSGNIVEAIKHAYEVGNKHGMKTVTTDFTKRRK